MISRSRHRSRWRLGMLPWMALVLVPVMVAGPSAAIGETVPPPVMEMARSAADHLADNLLIPLDKTKPLMVTALVDLDHLETTSILGRLMGDLMASRLVQRGYRLRETRMDRTPQILRTGGSLLALTDDPRRIGDQVEAQALVTGTYAATASHLVLSLRIVDAATHAVLAAHDDAFPLDDAIQGLLKPETSRGTGSSSPAEPGSGRLAAGGALLPTSHADSVRMIQGRLAELGYFKGTPDGRWGNRTRKALARFQYENGLPGHGNWDMTTQKRLFQDTGW